MLDIFEEVSLTAWGPRVSQSLRTSAPKVSDTGKHTLNPTWTPKGCRTIAFYRYGGHYFIYFGGLGKRYFDCDLGVPGLEGLRIQPAKEDSEL